MITLHLKNDSIECFGHAKVGIMQSIAVCGTVSALLQAVAMWTQDDTFIYRDGYSRVKMPKGDVKDFILTTFFELATLYDRNLVIVDKRSK